MTPHRPLEERIVADVMTADLLTISPDESVMMAWELMCQAHVHHLPVVDAQGRLLGIADAHTLASTWDSSGPGRARRPVRTILSGGAPPTVRPDAPVSAAASAMLTADTDHVAITDDSGRLTGLLTAHDLISSLAGVSREPQARHPAMPSLYRLEPVLPSSDVQPLHPGYSKIPPD